MCIFYTVRLHILNDKCIRKIVIVKITCLKISGKFQIRS